MAWEQVPGAALDIEIGPDGEVWMIGQDEGIYRWTGSDWEQVVGTAVRIAVGPSGEPWVLDHAGGIFRWVWAEDE
jgi:streptogramin lyase